MKKKRKQSGIKKSKKQNVSFENRHQITFQSWDSILKALRPLKDPKGGYVRCPEYDHW
ncbi:MAG: hypothetical protein UW81_C0006G0021 [Candidatus Giovannonibacteria bacterium GW2011_GWC2_44_9]|uniref:Uncharacterized protein n=3 Tax=Candidatus Giovannoniibacteriota TaxID=1752738 RepID=A0A0G1IY16_9BACT|nr:MAG: hypothetical protein UW49_C0004G0066 [Candidatus Giovannonibacteria bacterium GW2011_GWB1_44_23]KKT63955.1 MAG: hypothetical protein UW57_C0004G0065 [Candidatus Giovannonibacteria bacterium GW2011_GWA1_44_29]KKT84096.1 MAG: hypothetical protein UW81_C0006G0021 [Candidatus Giovannonibacteria bacterium GW2011_GWC2_44_9]KKT91668.1 MAG: hypothetical protein UW93_C0004G0066 [Parcubacteria group bacterium GW2011_GWC1_45_13]